MNSCWSAHPAQIELQLHRVEARVDLDDLILEPILRALNQSARLGVVVDLGIDRGETPD